MAWARGPMVAKDGVRPWAVRRKGERMDLAIGEMQVGRNRFARLDRGRGKGLGLWAAACRGLEQGRRVRSDGAVEADRFESLSCYDSALRGALEEAGLDEKGLVHLLECVALLSDGDR